MDIISEDKLRVIARVFNKTNKIYTNWEKDLFQLTPDRTSFKEIMQTLKKYFKYSEVKEKLRENKKGEK